MKKICSFMLILVISVSLIGCNNLENRKLQQTDENDKVLVAKLVTDFGSKLQVVSLQAPHDLVGKSMQENYGDYVLPALLTEWQSNPLQAPGRLTSSPWPDRIEILALEKSAEDTSEVKGKIIEITNTEKASGGFAAQRPISLTVKKIGNHWLISAVTLGAYEETNSIVYTDTQYDFDFSLPKSWQGYSLVTAQWEGRALGGSQDGKVIEKGARLSIRHPGWTAQKPRQDIPIMIFTLSQWNLVQQEKLSVGAAPIGPHELGRNSRYVFALPARYNFAFPTGYEEVEDIIKSKPLQANEKVANQ